MSAKEILQSAAEILRPPRPEVRAKENALRDLYRRAKQCPVCHVVTCPDCGREMRPEPGYEALFNSRFNPA